MLKQYGGELKRLFNTSGQDYRAQKLSQKLPTLSTADAIALLANNGNLVKRPFVIGKDAALVGFREDEWTQTIAR